MKSDYLLAGAMTAILAVTGAGLHLLVAPASARLNGSEPFLPHLAAAGGGSAVALAVLGGLRAPGADLVWLRMHIGWESRDWPATDLLLRLAPVLDPRPLYFWLNGARIIACDFPEWRIAAAGGPRQVVPSEMRRMRREQAASALAFLTTAMTFHPRSSELWIERAAIELYQVGDAAAAAESFRRAAELPGAPIFAARLHALLLRRLGRREEALAWLVRLHGTLPRPDEAAEAAVVLARIRELEGELGVTPGKSYQAIAD